MDQRVHRIALTLVEAGMEVMVVGRWMKNSKPLSARRYGTKRFSLLFKKGPLFYLNFNLRLFRYLLFSRADFYHANDLDTLLANFLASKFKRAQLVYDSHEFFTELPELVRRPRVQKIWKRLERWIFPKLKRVCTVNESIAQRYQDLYKVKVNVVRNLPLRRMEKWSPQREKILLYQGALNEGRGIELMIGAMKFLPGYRLHIYGGGPIENELRARVESLPNREQIKISGWIGFEELQERTPEGFLGLSLEEDTGQNYRFALPNKIFDYVQAGVPVLVSDLPEMSALVNLYGVGEVLQNEERTAEKLAAKILELDRNMEKWNRYFNQCETAAKALCWENEKKVLLDLYEA